MNTFTRCICPDPDNPREGCSLADMFDELELQGELRAFTAAYYDYGYGPQPGNCHGVCVALMLDLMAAGRSQGWTWVTGFGKFAGPWTPAFEHSWMEFDGWVLDAASGKMLVIDASLYIRMTQGRVTTRRDALATRGFLHELTSSPHTRQSRTKRDRNSNKRARRARKNGRRRNS